MKKFIFSASIFIGKHCNLIQIFSNYGKTKCQTVLVQKYMINGNVTVVLTCAYFPNYTQQVKNRIYNLLSM